MTSLILLVINLLGAAFGGLHVPPAPLDPTPIVCVMEPEGGCYAERP